MIPKILNFAILTEVVWLEDPEAPVEVRLLSEDGAHIAAVPLAPSLVPAPLQENDTCLLTHLLQPPETLTQPPPVLRKQLHWHLEGVQPHSEVTVRRICFCHD